MLALTSPGSEQKVHSSNFLRLLLHGRYNKLACVFLDFLFVVIYSVFPLVFFRMP